MCAMKTAHEPLIGYVTRRLAETKRMHKVLAVESGVPYSTIAKISQGRITNPGVLTAQQLADTLRAWERRKPVIQTA